MDAEQDQDMSVFPATGSPQVDLGLRGYARACARYAVCASRIEHDEQRLLPVSTLDSDKEK